MRRAQAGSVGLALLAVAVLAGCGTAEDIRAGQTVSSPNVHSPAQTTPGQSPEQPSTSIPPSSPPPSTGTLPPGYSAGPAGTGLSRFYNQHVVWKPCGVGDSCAAILVPLDYAKPDGTAITIQAKRVPALDPSRRVGTLFVNPGGPGGSGVDYVDRAPLGQSVREIYDAVGFDPRGVGTSTPIHCVSNQFLDEYLAADPSPDTPAEVDVLRTQWEHLAHGCQINSGALLAHVSTIEAARDMDILRAVVGSPKLDYYGASYGTYLGATYAALFPDHVGRLVLDGALDPESSPHAIEIGQTKGFQTALTDYLNYCVDQGGCPLGDTVDAAQNRLVALLDSLDQHPLPTSSGRALTQGLAFYGVILPLYSVAGWPVESQALQMALDGDGSGLLAMSDQYSGRQPDGSYDSNSLEVQNAVNCLDHPENESVAQIEAGRSAFMKASPVFGSVAAWFPYGCSNWPVKPTLPKPDYSAPGAPPIVVVGTTNDPATPYDWAVGLSKELDSGVLLTRVGDGHTAYSSGNACISTALDTFFVTGNPPADGARC